MLVPKQVLLVWRNPKIHHETKPNEITTTHFDCAYNYPSVPQQLLREHTHQPFLLTQTRSTILPHTHPQQPKRKSRKK
jgi:hypothetical protein